MGNQKQPRAYWFAKIVIGGIAAGLCFFAVWTIVVLGGQIASLLIALTALSFAVTLFADVFEQKKLTAYALIATVIFLVLCAGALLLQVPGA